MDLHAIAAIELAGLDPYDLMDVEAARIDAFMSTLPDADWAAPTPCAGWDRHDLTAHLGASEEYNHASLDDTVGELLERSAAAGATDVHTFNQAGVDTRRDRSHADILDEWRTVNADTRTRLRARDGDDLSTMVGPYAARWQAFHLAAELATHADDLGVPVTTDESAGRLAWRARVARFIVAETHPEVTLASSDGGTTVSVGSTSATLDDAMLVAAAAGRLGDDSTVPAEIRVAIASVG